MGILNNKPVLILIQIKQIGDVLMTTPAIAALRKEYPAGKIYFVTSKMGEKVLHNNPHIDEFVLVPPTTGIVNHIKFCLKIRQLKGDILIDFQSGARTSQFAFFSGAGIKVGLADTFRRFFYSKRVTVVTGQYSAFKKLEMVKSLGIVTNPSALPEIYPGESEHLWASQIWHNFNLNTQMVIAFSPVSLRDYKRWPIDDFAWLADKIINQYHVKLIVMVGPNEMNTARQFIKKIDNKDSVYLPDAHTLIQAAALFKQCECYVGNDNGLRHIAIAMGVSTFALFSPSIIPTVWTPPNNPAHFTLLKPANTSINKKEKDMEAKPESSREDVLNNFEQWAQLSLSVKQR